jgi:hypothetical protein
MYKKPIDDVVMAQNLLFWRLKLPLKVKIFIELLNDGLFLPMIT